MTISYTSEDEGHLNYYRAKEEIQVGIKLSDKEIRAIWGKMHVQSKAAPAELQIAADAATAHAVREIFQNCDVTAKTPKGMTVIRECTALLAEAGVKKV